MVLVVENPPAKAGAWVQSLVRKNPPAAEQLDHVLQLLTPAHLEPVLPERPPQREPTAMKSSPSLSQLEKSHSIATETQ